MIGFYNVNKPTGISSSNVVVKLKHILKRKDIGHMGTLDPMASGVLPIGIGKATRLFDYLVKSDKRYIATFQFGIKTDSDDITGNIIKKENFNIKKTDLESAIKFFIGRIKQLPSKFSAIKINGRRAYKLARKNIEFEMKEREVNIYDIKLLSFDGELFKIDVSCEGGTYIRTLGIDIAEKLGTICTMISLNRVKSSSFSIENAVLIDKIAENENKYLINVKDALKLKTIKLNDTDFAKVKNGIKLKFDSDANSVFYVENLYGILLGIGQIENGYLKIKTNLYEGE